MKKLLKGFSLAELLIALGIISIIATMGISISKKGVEKAYSYYIYNAYKSFTIAYIESKKDTYTLRELAENISKVLGGKCNDKEGTEYIIKVPNNTIYTLTQDNTTGLKIKITVPSARWTDDSGNINTQKTYNFAIDYNNPEYGIVPLGDLQKRVDLLPFTIEDGISGKIVQKFNSETDKLNSPEYLDSNNKQIKIYSYQKAFCKLYGEKTNNTLGISISCGGITRDAEGIIKMLDPRKIF